MNKRFECDGERKSLIRKFIDSCTRLFGRNDSRPHLRRIEELEAHRARLAQQLKTLRKTVHDLTCEKTKALEDEKPLHALFKRIIESSSEAIAVSDAAGRLIYVNPAHERLFGRSLEDAKKLNLRDYYAPESIETLDRQVAPTLARGESWEGELDVLDRGGRRFTLRERADTIRDSSGRMLYAFGRMHDVSAGKSTEEALESERAAEEILRLNQELEARVRQRTSQLEVTNRELESFAYSVSHDLRAPLRGIEGFSQALLEGYEEKLDETGCDYLERIRAASRRMGTLIDELLRLSRLSQLYRPQIRTKTVELSDMVQEIAVELQQSQPDRQVEFVIAPAVRAHGDSALLRVVMSNLLANAWKFTSHREKALIEFGSRGEGQRTVYFVRDNGAGFDMAYAEKLFGPFQRLHTTTEFPGTGIGLATVQRIVHCHGGRIWGEGVVDQGATLTFSLAHDPSSSSPPSAHERTSIPRAPSCSTKSP